MILNGRGGGGGRIPGTNTNVVSKIDVLRILTNQYFFILICFMKNILPYFEEKTKPTTSIISIKLGKQITSN